MFIYRDEYYNPEETDQQGLAEVHIAKHRNGPTDTVKLSFLKRYAKFADLAQRVGVDADDLRARRRDAFAGLCDECLTAEATLYAPKRDPNVAGTLRRYVDVGFRTCPRGHRILVKRVRVMERRMTHATGSRRRSRRRSGASRCSSSIRTG